MSDNTWTVDFRMLYTRIRWSEAEHAHTSHFSEIFKRKYIEENNLVRGHAKNFDFSNVHERSFYGSRSNAEQIRLASVFTRFRRILSAWVEGARSISQFKYNGKYKNETFFYLSSIESFHICIDNNDLIDQYFLYNTYMSSKID
jgi:hypothetical protein